MVVCNFEAVCSLWDGRAWKWSHRYREGKSFPLLCYSETDAPSVTAWVSSNSVQPRQLCLQQLFPVAVVVWNQEVNCSAQEITLPSCSLLILWKALLLHDRREGMYDTIQPWPWWMKLLSKRVFTGPTTASFLLILPAKSYKTAAALQNQLPQISFQRAPLHHILPGGNMSLCQLVPTSGSSPSLGIGNNL